MFSNQAFTSLDIATQVRAASKRRGRDLLPGAHSSLSQAAICCASLTDQCPARLGHRLHPALTRSQLPAPLPAPAAAPLLQSLVAFHLGKADRRSAAAVFRRTLGLAVAAGVAILGLLLAARESLPGVFTKDPAVVRQVALVRRASQRLCGLLLGWTGQQGCELPSRMLLPYA